MGEAGYGAGGGTRGAGIARSGSIDAFVESGEDLGGLKCGHIDEAAPYSSGGEAPGLETSDDAEIIGAAFESAPEVWVSRFGGCGDGSGGEDDFVAENVGADQAEVWREEGETACLCLGVSSGSE